MTALPPLALRFLGFGEAASLFAKGFAQSGLSGMAAFDVSVHGGPGEALLRERAASTGTMLMTDRAEFSAAEWVFAMVQPSKTEIAAQQVAPHLRPGSFYVDFSSASPERKQAASRVVEAQGAHYIDCGIVGSVPSSGLAVPVVSSGPQAATFRERFKPCGMDITVVGDRIGAAATIKLIRSILAKGLEALYVEALTVAERAGVSESVLDSFCGLLDARSARATAELLLRSHVVHAARRADEVTMSRDMVLEVGVAPVMTDAIIEVMRGTAAAGVSPRRSRWRCPFSTAHSPIRERTPTQAAMVSASLERRRPRPPRGEEEEPTMTTMTAPTLSAALLARYAKVT